MKRVIVILFLFPLSSIAQKLKLNEYDKSTKQWRIESFPVKLKSSQDTKMDMALTAAGNSLSLYLIGSGIGTNTVDMGSQVIFLLDNDSTVTVRSAAVQSFDYSKLVPAYRHEYVLTEKDLEKLAKSKLKSLRKYSAGGFDDITLENKNAAIVQELIRGFVRDLKQANSFQGAVLAKKPAFPGGEEVLQVFLNRNLRIPPELKNGEEKTVLVEFLVSDDGSIYDLRIKESAGPTFDNESLRVMSRMPKWKPASEDGKYVDAVVTQPVLFSRAGR